MYRNGAVEGFGELRREEVESLGMTQLEVLVPTFNKHPHYEPDKRRILNCNFDSVYYNYQWFRQSAHGARECLSCFNT